MSRASASRVEPPAAVLLDTTPPALLDPSAERRDVAEKLQAIYTGLGEPFTFFTSGPDEATLHVRSPRMTRDLADGFVADPEIGGEWRRRGFKRVVFEDDNGSAWRRGL